jgi:hypothetical protein
MILHRHTGKAILVVLIFMAFSIKSNFAQVGKIYEENILINCFFKDLYNFSFREADSMVIVMGKTNMDKATISNIKANLAWWKLLSGDAIDQNLKSCNSNIDESINLLLKSERQDIISLLNLIYSYSLKVRIENYKGNTIRSLFNFYKSIDYMEKCITWPVKDENIYFVLGLYYYFADYFENEYVMMSALFFPFPKGDKIKGLKYLEESSSSKDEMIRTEANYFLLKIYAYTEKNYQKAYRNAQILTQQHPDNLVYSLEQLKLLLVLKKSSEAQIFQNKLIGEIETAGNINNIQKNHFLYQIEELTKNMNQF